MGAELGRKRAGKKTKTGMSEGKLEHFATKVETQKASKYLIKRARGRKGA